MSAPQDSGQDAADSSAAPPQIQYHEEHPVLEAESYTAQRLVLPAAQAFLQMARTNVLTAPCFCTPLAYDQQTVLHRANSRRMVE